MFSPKKYVRNRGNFAASNLMTYFKFSNKILWFHKTFSFLSGINSPTSYGLKINLQPCNKGGWNNRCYPGGGGGGRSTQLFSGRGVRPGFPKWGACKLRLASEKGACELKISPFEGLWAENFQIWGLVNWKFPNLRACELKISKFGGLRAKIWAKIEAVEAKISKFS